MKAPLLGDVQGPYVRRQVWLQFADKIFHLWSIRCFSLLSSAARPIDRPATRRDATILPDAGREKQKGGKEMKGYQG